MPNRPYFFIVLKKFCMINRILRNYFSNHYIPTGAVWSIKSLKLDKISEKEEISNDQVFGTFDEI